MAQQWLYARDLITVNSSLDGLIHAEMSANHLAAGDTIVLAARTCIQDPTYTWAPKGFNVLVVADSYLYGSGTGTGGIDLTGTAGGTGTAGVAGTPGVQSAENPVDGGPGGPGGTGGAGGPANTITVLARTLDPITLRAAGGAGGPGGVGGKGGNGTAGRVINRIPPIIIEPTSPGPGGNGGTGGAGGPAGAVTVGYVTPGPRGTPQYPLTSAVGGAGGPGGAGGAGGTGGINSPARAGSPGAQGAAGGNAAVTVTHGDDAAFWAAVAARLTPANRNTWGNHRLRVGRYLYRTFNAADPAHQGDLFAAYREFQAVVALGTPDSPAATQWSTWITNNLNALGLPYDIWLKPDFDGFQAIYLGYAPTLIPLVQAVTQLLNTAITGGDIHGMLDIMQAEASNQSIALTADQTAASRAVSDSQSLLGNLNNQMSSLQAQINAQQAALQQARYEFAANMPGAVAWDVLQGVVTLATSGLLGLPGLVKPAWSPLSQGFTIESLLEDKGKEKNPIIELAGGLAGMVAKNVPLLSLFKNLDENNNATISQDQANIKALTAKAVDLKFQVLRQQDDLAEAQLRLAAVQAHIAACNRDVDTIKAVGQIQAGQFSAIADVVGMLLDLISRVSEFVVRYVFLAARALDVFGFTDGTVVAPATATGGISNVASLPLDFGMVAPDVVAEALLELRRGSATRCAGLLAALMTSWATAPAWSMFTQRGTDLANSLTASRFFIEITDPGVLNQLRTTGTATFKVSMANLPGTAAELKIRNVFVNLVGATSPVPSLNGMLTHAGNAQAIRRDGTTLQLSSPPMTSFMIVGLASGQIPAAPTQAPSAPKEAPPVSTDPVSGKTAATTTTVGASDLPAYYGRSPVTTWMFTLADPNPVNLSGLTAVEVGVNFLAATR